MRKKAYVVFTLVLLVSFILTGAVQAAEKYKGYSRGEIFITAQEVNQLMQAKDPKLVVIAVASKTEYFSGHIPGSFHLWRPDYEADPKTQGGVTDNILQPEGYTKLMQGLGIDADSKVVVYDHKYDATRLWWAFYYYGKTDVRILDGGIKAWKNAGYLTDLIAGGNAARPGTWVAKLTYPAMRVDTPDIMALKDRSDAQLWDVRKHQAVLRPGNPIGRLPCRPHSLGGTGRLGPCEDEREMMPSGCPRPTPRKFFEKLAFDSQKPQYFYCQSGVRTTQMISTLYALGWPMEKLFNYDSSWIGWSLDSKLPIEKDCPDTTPAPWQKK